MSEIPGIDNISNTSELLFFSFLKEESSEFNPEWIVKK
jgi:hypothetical protein